jgi:hypothetical protein
MNKLIMLAVALSITSLFALMLWAQAGRFEKDAIARPEAHPSSFRSPYLPAQPMKPIF